MAKIRIVYGSETGNTQQAAHIIEDLFSKYGHEVQIQEARETEPTDICQGVDLTVLGSSSRGDSDSISFPPSFTHFYEELREGKIKEKKIALFGCGDSHKPFFCGAVELLKEKVGDLGGGPHCRTTLHRWGTAEGSKKHTALESENCPEISKEPIGIHWYKRHQWFHERIHIGILIVFLSGRLRPSFFLLTIERMTCFKNVDFHLFIESLTRTIELKDLYTAGHSRRVSELAELICREMRMSDEYCDYLHVIGHLHDIGKIGIAEGILMKSGKLSQPEYMLMQQHSAIGDQFLRISPDLKRWVE